MPRQSKGEDNTAAHTSSAEMRDDVQTTTSDKERARQKALEFCYVIGAYTGVSMEGYTLSPSEKHLNNAFKAFSKQTDSRTLTYSNFNTFYAIGARLLLAAICQFCNIPLNFNCSGLSVWKHRWDLDDSVASRQADDDANESSHFGCRCYHGRHVTVKNVEYSLRANTAAACEALKKGNAYTHTNKNNNTVVMVQNSYGICSYDANEKKAGDFCPESCGIVFSDLRKAKAAMKYAEYLTKMYLPNGNTNGWLIIPTACDCNGCGEDIAGRQIPKMTPWGISDTKMHTIKTNDRVLLENPHVFMFQCCNFQHNKRKLDDKQGKKHCDFRISYPDLLRAFSIAKSLLKTCFPDLQLKIYIPRFKWSDDLCVKSTVLPQVNIVCGDKDPFGWNSLEDEESYDDDDEA